MEEVISVKENVRVRYRELFENSLDLIYVLDLNGNFLDANDVALNTLGYKREEIPSIIFKDLIGPDQMEKAFSDLEDIIENGRNKEQNEYIIKKKNGESIFIETYGIPIREDGKLLAIIEIASDITAKKRAEQKLKDSKEKYRSILENIKDGYFEVDLKGNFTYVNDSFCESWGYTKDEILERNFKLYTEKEQAKKIFQVYNEVYSTENDNPHFEYETNKKNGEKIIVETSVHLKRDNQGRKIGFFGISRDNTLRKMAEKKLIDSEEKYRSILENIKEGYFEVDLKGNFTFVNDFFYENLGYSEEEIIGNKYITICDEESAKKLMKVYNTIYTTENDNPHFEHESLKKNGEIIYIETSAYLKRDSQGNKIGFFGLARDITERKTTEQKLKESEEKYRLISERANDLIATLNDKFEYDYINENVHRKIMGYSKEDLIGKSSLDFLHPDDTEYGVKQLRKGFLEGEGMAEMRIKDKSGRYRWFEIRGTTFKDVDGKSKGILISRDINERKIAEQKLKESERKYRLISENAYDMITVLNDKFEYEYINEKAHKDVLGYSKEDLIGQAAVNMLHPDDVRSVLKKWRKGLKTGEETAELRYRKKDGTYLWLEVRGKIFKDPDDVLKGILIARDINKRKIGEQELRESEEKYRSILENMKDGYIEVDLKGNYKFVNTRVSEVLGYSKEELLSMNFSQVVAKADVTNMFKSFNRLYNNEISDLFIDLEVITKDGQHKFVNASVYLNYDSLGNKIGFKGLFRDITEKKEAEYMILQEREKLKELDLLKRDLTTQLSEKLKYPLSVISDVSEVLLESYQDQLDKNAQKLIELIRDGGVKSSNMIERILDISKIESDRFELNKKVENLNEIVNESIHRAYEDLDLRDVGINLRSSEDLFSEVDKIRFKQIFEYYLTNSLRTIPKKGELSILLNEENNYAEIQIKSSGIELKYDEFPFEIQYSDEIMKLHQGSIVREFNREEKSRNIIIRLPIISWFNQLIHIFIIYRTGVLLYDHQFVKERDPSDALIISGGMIGVMSILKEIMRGADHIDHIDHGDRKIMFELNNTEEIVFALLVKEENPVIRRKLNALIKDFEGYFKEKIKDIRYTSMRSNEWREVSNLIKKHFKFQD